MIMPDCGVSEKRVLWMLQSVRLGRDGNMWQLELTKTHLDNVGRFPSERERRDSIRWSGPM